MSGQTQSELCRMLVPAGVAAVTICTFIAEFAAGGVPLRGVGGVYGQGWNKMHWNCNILQYAIPILYWSGLKDCIVDWNVVQ